MKITCNKSELSHALSSLCRIVPVRTNYPILTGCLLTAIGQTLILQCTDLELSLEINIPVQVEEEGSLIVTAKHFFDLVRKLQGDRLSLSWSEESKLLELNYDTAKSNFFTWDAEEFPLTEQKPIEYKINFPGGKWKKIINKVITAAASQDVRINYAGVYVRFDNEKIQMAATDAYRLAFIKIPNTTDIVDCDLFIPVKALIEVNRLAADSKDLEISWNAGNIYFKTEEFILSSRLINNQFPDYEKVIPQEPELKINVPRDILLTTLERASLFVSPEEQYAVAVLKVEDDRLILTAHATEIGSLEEIIFLQEPTVKKCEASFNAKYLLDPLQVMDKEYVTLCLNGTSGPAVYIEDDEEGFYLHLISPVCRVS